MPDMQADDYMQSLVTAVTEMRDRGCTQEESYVLLAPRLLKEMLRIHQILGTANQLAQLAALECAEATVAGDVERAAEARGFVRGVHSVLGEVLNRD